MRRLERRYLCLVFLDQHGTGGIGQQASGPHEPLRVLQDVALHALNAETVALGIARVAASRDPGPRPAPLYVRPADAAPSRDAPPVILP